uniref:histone acetyltransferase n=1 Tax=Myotis lucifugus TaxID=59463 RepID=G1Q0Z1_MYOLU
SSLAMLLQVHSQGQDRRVLTCTECKQRVETGWHCPGCQDYDLCINCYNTKGHTHEMVKVGLGLEEEAEEAEEGDEGGNQGELQSRSIRQARRLSILRCIQSLRHARQCGDTNCSRTDCQKLKRVVLHTTRCQRKAIGGCPVCKQLIALCCYHAKQCQENPCPVPLCLNIKQKLREQRLRRRQQRIGNRLLQADATMNSRHVPQQSSIPSAPPWTPPQQPNTPQTPQPPTQSQPRPVSMSLAGFFSSARTPPVSTGKPTNLQLQPTSGTLMPPAAMQQQQIQQQIGSQASQTVLGPNSQRATGLSSLASRWPHASVVSLQTPVPASTFQPITMDTPQPSPHHLSPQTGSPHPGLPVTMASSIDQGHLGNPKYARLPQLNTPTAVHCPAVQTLDLRDRHRQKGPQQRKGALCVLERKEKLKAPFGLQFTDSHLFRGEPGQTPQPRTQSQPRPPQPCPRLQPSLQNLKAMQASGPRPAVPPQQQMGGLNPQGQALNIMNLGATPSCTTLRDAGEQQQQQQQQQQEGSAGMAAGLGHAQFQQPQGMPPAAMQQQLIQQQIGSQASQTVLGPNSAQFFLLSPLEAPVLSAVSCYSHFRCHRSQLSRSEQVRQKIKKHGLNTPHKPQQHMLSESHRPLLPGQQMATCLSSQVRSLAPVPSPPQSQPPHSSPSPRIPQPSPHHLSPQTGSPHPGLPVTMASSIDQGHLGNPKYARLPQLNTPRSALSSELSLIGDTTIDTLEKFV